MHPTWPSLSEARRRRIERFHDTSGTPNSDEPVEWQNRPELFLRYTDTIRQPLLRPPRRSLQDQLDDGDGGPREALYTEPFSYWRFAIPTVPLTEASLSQFLYDSLAVTAERPCTTWPLPHVNPSCGGFHPTEAHVIAPSVPGLFGVPFVAHYSSEDHALEVRGSVPYQFFDRYLPYESKSMLVGLSTIFWREAWRYGDRAFRYCHLDVGHAIASLAFAAAALGWEARLLDGLGQQDLERIMGFAPFRPILGVGGKQGPDKFPCVELQDPVCVLLIFPNNVEPCQLGYKALSLEILRNFERVIWLGKPNLLAKGEHVVQNEIYRTAQDVERPEAAEECLVIEPFGYWGSKSYTGFSGYENLMVREVVRSRKSAAIMDWNYHMEAEIFYQFLHHCLPSGYCGRKEGQKKQRAFPFGVLPWESKIDVFVFVHRVQRLHRGLYCLVRNADHFDVLRQGSLPAFEWQQSKRWSDMGLPLYRLLSEDLQEEVKEIACQQPIAMNGCFTVMMVAPFDDVKELKLWMYPRLFWESGVLGHLLSLDAQALGISACGIGSFFDKKANRFLGFENSCLQTLYLYSVGKPISD